MVDHKKLRTCGENRLVFAVDVNRRLKPIKLAYCSGEIRILIYVSADYSASFLLSSFLQKVPSKQILSTVLMLNVNPSFDGKGG